MNHLVPLFWAECDFLNVCCLLNKLLRQKCDRIVSSMSSQTALLFTKSQLCKHSWKNIWFKELIPNSADGFVSAASHCRQMFSAFHEGPGWSTWSVHWALSACCGSLEDADPEFVISTVPQFRTPQAGGASVLVNVFCSITSVRVQLCNPPWTGAWSLLCPWNSLRQEC